MISNSELRERGWGGGGGGKSVVADNGKTKE